MKQIIATALIATAGFAGTAFAQEGPTLADEVTEIAPSVDVSNLTDEEIRVVNGMVRSGESTSEKRAKIVAYLQ